MIAPLLPDLAADLSVGIGTAGQLVTVFALTYALSSPILTALTGSIQRRRLLIGAMAAFALANVVACAAPSYWALMGARVLLAIAAGLYVPSANAPGLRSSRARATRNGLVHRVGWHQHRHRAGRASRCDHWRPVWLAPDVRRGRPPCADRNGRAVPPGPRYRPRHPTVTLRQRVGVVRRQERVCRRCSSPCFGEPAPIRSTPTWPSIWLQ